ncbi:MAG: hypothetical protein Q4D89_13645, partial [Arachnia propionica]|uniref:hypothetical protein n=1 Tax=Arachnia propionica TaxID=1750 RepID=UPI0027032382|nr:hypothetical protein [Arachnia propionica]
MNGYLLLTLELFLILAVCATLAFLAGWFLSKRRRVTVPSEPVAALAPEAASLAAGPGTDMVSGDTVRVYDEAQYRAVEKRAVEAERRATDAEARVDQVNSRMTEAQARLTAAEERFAQAEARAAEAEERAVKAATPEPAVTSESVSLAGHDARIAELEALAERQEREMARLEKRATAAWDKTMPQLLERITVLESDLDQAQHDNAELKSLLDLERGVTGPTATAPTAPSDEVIGDSHYDTIGGEPSVQMIIGQEVSDSIGGDQELVIRAEEPGAIGGDDELAIHAEDTGAIGGDDELVIRAEEPGAIGGDEQAFGLAGVAEHIGQEPGRGAEEDLEAVILPKRADDDALGMPEDQEHPVEEAEGTDDVAEAVGDAEESLQEAGEIEEVEDGQGLTSADLEAAATGSGARDEEIEETIVLDEMADATNVMVLGDLTTEPETGEPEVIAEDAVHTDPEETPETAPQEAEIDGLDQPSSEHDPSGDDLDQEPTAHTDTDHHDHLTPEDQDEEIEETIVLDEMADATN